VDGFDVGVAEVDETVEKLGLAGRWRGHDLRLDSLAISSARGELALSGDLAFVDDWPLTINADLQTLPLGDYGAHTVNARLRGDLSDASLKLDTRGTVLGSLTLTLTCWRPEYRSVAV
jgi:autotransporter translocation and assembly factor TamB